jgi:hypothetical protein
MDGDQAVTGSPVVRAGRVQVSEEVVRIGAPPSEEKPGEPTVRIVREGDAVQALEVTCSCGERIRIRCEY